MERQGEYFFGEIRGELSQVTGKIQTVQNSVEELQRDRQAEATRMSDLEKRVGAVENRSTALGSHAEGEGERRRALIMGGWSEDNTAASTLESAKAMVAQLRLDIDFGEAFVTGIRRGYVMVPYTARQGETEGHCRERLRGAMARVRQANIPTGDEGPQDPRRLWLNYSSSPDLRKRAILAGKIKRAVLEWLSLLRHPYGTGERRWQVVVRRLTIRPRRWAAAGWLR